ncbi:MAG: GAF domain-containing protein [Phycisphaerae bacterium]|nr:GAF domain-containing protein [Phycisphaerae bacterium]
MIQTERYKRLRLLVKKLNKQRKQQANKVDILCNDLIGAQRSFLRRLQDIGFAAEFYRSLLGGTDLNGILTRAGRVIKQELPGAGVSFFIRQSDGCELHACEGDESLYCEHSGPQEGLDPELAETICKHNKPCMLDDIAGMSMNGDLGILNKFSLVTLPLSDLGRSLGFVLIYCPLPQVLNMGDMRRISPAMHGLAQAIRALRVALPSSE